jgi:hypothetical protein
MAHLDLNNQQILDFDINDPPPLPAQLQRTGDRINRYTVHVYMGGGGL